MKLLSAMLLCVVACAAPARADDAMLQVGGHGVRAELATTQEAREHGLMQRKRLCADCGMLFVFPAEGRYRFWMKDTPLPLAIAFVARDGRILNIEEMRPNTPDVHPAAGDALYALEMNSGWFAAHGVRPGDKVQGIPAIHAE